MHINQIQASKTSKSLSVDSNGGDHQQTKQNKNKNYDSIDEEWRRKKKKTVIKREPERFLFDMWQQHGAELWLETLQPNVAQATKLLFICAVLRESVPFQFE